MPNVLISADAFTGDIFHEDRYFFGVAGPYSPVLMAANYQTGIAYGSPIYGPFSANSALYCLLGADSGASIGVFKSSDSGATWSEVDAANHPANGNNAVSCCILNGTTTLVVVYLNGAAPAHLRFRNFDLTTDTWGAAYGAEAGGPANVGNVSALYVRPDATVAVFYQITPNPAVPASNMKAAIYSQPSPGGAWVTTIDVGVNLVSDPGWGGGDSILVNKSCSVMDSTGLIHLFPCDTQNGVDAYQQFKTDNTLGAYQNFKAPQGAYNLQVFSGLPIGHPVIVGANIVVPVSVRLGPWPSGNPGLQTATVLVGTPLAAPVFTLVGIPGIDPDDADWIAFGENTNTPSNVPFLFYDGTTLYAIWPRVDSDGTGNQFSQVRLGTNTGDPGTISDWSDVTVFDLAVDSPPGFNFAGQQVQLPSVAVFAAPVPAAPAPLLGSGGGGNVPVLGCQCCPTIRAPFQRRTREEELDALPRGSSHVEIRGTAVGPANTTPVILCQYQVPNNRRFQLDGLVAIAQQIAGWTPGDGNVIFSLTINRTIGGTQAQGAPFNNYGTVTIPLGSLQVPWFIPRVDRLTLFSREILRLTVQTDPAFILPGAGTRFLGLLKGYEW